MRLIKTFSLDRSSKHVDLDPQTMLSSTVPPVLIKMMVGTGSLSLDDGHDERQGGGGPNYHQVLQHHHPGTYSKSFR